MSEMTADRLVDYESLKFALAEVLRALSRLLPEDAHLQRSILYDSFVRLAEDRFNVLFVGRFNRGKTTLMNALLGTDRLPTGILPVTSAITSVAYGSTEKLQIEFENGPFRYDVPMDSLGEYITEKHNPGNARGIREVHISLPAELLRRGFHFVDSPGLGSAIAQNTLTTERYFPEADAIVCVTAYESPITSEEAQALEVFARRRIPLLVVLNKRDTVSAAEREEVERYVQEQLRGIVPHNVPPIFSTCATAELAARQPGKPAAPDASGIAALETELIRLLRTEKGPRMVSGVCEHAASLLNELNSNEGLILQKRLAEIQVRVAADDFRSMAPSSPSPRITHCVVCDSVGRGLYDSLRTFQYELATNPPARDRLAMTRGLCSSHTWLYATLSRDRDICVGLVPLMRRIANDLAALQKGSDGTEHQVISTETANSWGDSCELCVLQEQLEALALANITQQLSKLSEVPPQNIPGVCLPHLRKLAQLDRSQRPMLQVLASRLAPAAARLVEDMERYVLKRDARRHGLASDEESQAASRALEFVAGRAPLRPRP